MPPGPASPVCHSTVVQFVAYILLHPSFYLDQQFMRQTSYRVTNTKFPFFFFSLEKRFSTAGSGSKQAALTGSQTKNELNGELRSSYIFGCDFLTVFRFQFKPKQQ